MRHGPYFFLFYNLYKMKKIVLLACLSALCGSIGAQPIITGNQAPVKLSDAVANYNKYIAPYRQGDKDKDAGPKFAKEDREKDYQFKRWLWYWQQHLDANGYMVSPMKTWEEWSKLQQKNTAAKTTSTAIRGDWTFQGPDSSEAGGEGVGRINVVAFHPTDVNTFWIGSPGGGAWKTTNNGANWTCMTDQLPLLSISDIKFNPLNPNTVYMCTGDRDGQDYYSIGVLKSTNGGTTWNTTGISWTTSQFNVANSILVNPIDTNSLVLAATDGIYRSFNGGTTWTQVVPAGDYMQLLYRPNDTNIVYATSYYDYASSTNAQIWRSKDGGTTWTQVSSFTDADRVSLAVTAANPNIVKALVSAVDATNADGLSGIYSSSDTGHTFTQVFAGGCSGTQNLLSFNQDGTGCGGQGWYDLPIAISPANANLVYIGGVNGWNSVDGGVTWTIMNQWYPGLPGVAAIHADKHFMGFNPLLPTRFFETNDGGIYSSDDAIGSGVWNNLTNGLGITEFYRVSVSDGAGYEIAGAQDVGTKKVQPGLFEVADGGDGMETAIDFADATVAYASSENGYIDILSPVSALNPNDISYNIPPIGNVEGTGGWVTPFIIEPSCHTCLLAGYTQVYRSPDEGNSWTAISPVLTTSSGYGDLLRVVTTIADSNTIYVAEDGTTNIFYTHNQGGSWTTITAPYTGFTTSDVQVDPRDKDHIWVTFSGYGSPQVAEWTLSGGWSLLNTSLPDVPVNCIAVDKINRDLYVGTDIGVFYRDTTMSAWVPYTNGMPSLRVNDLQINYATSEIWAATFGRSLWKSGKHLSTSSVSIVPFLPDAISINPNPNHGSFTVTANNINDKQVTMRLIDNAGKTVWEQQGVLHGNKLDVNVKGIISGTYLFELGTEQGIAGRQKMVIY